MTEGDRAFLKTCLRTELRRAHLASCAATRARHLSAAAELEQQLAGKVCGRVSLVDTADDFRLAA